MNRSLASKILLLVVLIAPMLILLGMTAQSRHSLKNAPTFILPIEGYDPRDPVYGHYFQFQIKWPWRLTDPMPCSGEKPQDCVVCFQNTGAKSGKPVTPSVAVIAATDARQNSCLATMGSITYFSPATKDRYNENDIPPRVYIANIPHRFYIDEKHGKPLEDYFREHAAAFAVQVKIHNNAMHLEKLLIDGRDYRETLYPNR